MNTQIEARREFWQGVLSAGGATAIPRWTPDPVPGVAEYVAALPAELVGELRRLAGGMELPLHTLALAAHAKVLAALSGEQDTPPELPAGLDLRVHRIVPLSAGAHSPRTSTAAQLSSMLIRRT